MNHHWCSCSLLLCLTLVQVWSFQLHLQPTLLRTPVRADVRFTQISDASPLTTVSGRQRLITITTSRRGTGRIVRQRVDNRLREQSSSLLLVPPQYQHLLFSLDESFLPVTATTATTAAAVAATGSGPSSSAISTIIKVSLSVIVLYLGLHGVEVIQDVMSSSSGTYQHGFWRRIIRFVSKWILGKRLTTSHSHSHSHPSTHGTRTVSTPQATESTTTGSGGLHHRRIEKSPTTSVKSTSPSSVASSAPQRSHSATTKSLASSQQVNVKRSIKPFPWMKCSLESKSRRDQRFTTYTFETPEELPLMPLMSRQVSLPTCSI